MRRVRKIAFSFLIWPILVMAQDPRPPDQPDPSVQSPPSENNSAPVPDTTTGASPVPPPTAPMPAPSAILPGPTPAAAAFRPINQPPIAPGYFTMFNLSAGYSVTISRYQRQAVL